MKNLNLIEERQLNLQHQAHLASGGNHNLVKWTSRLQLDPIELKQAVDDGWLKSIKGWLVDADMNTGIVSFAEKPNLFVNGGINVGLDRLFGITASAALTMGVDNGTNAPVAASVSSTTGSGTDTGSTSRRIIALDSVATRTNQVVSAIGTFTQANVAFAMKRLFLSKAAAGTTDASGDLIAMTAVFTIDLTAFATWSQTFTATLTGTGS